jgi:2-amino-4-hydroxy-6-hydroxymethyldihydropteridine diphosphokinase
MAPIGSLRRSISLLRDMKSQPDFLNTVTRCTTELSAAEMLKRIHSIELKGGRRRASVPAKGPRTIDIDILPIW